MIRFLVAALFAAVSPLLFAEAPARLFHIPSLYHVGYWVRDIAKSRAFYHDKLGFEEPYSLNHPDGTLQMVVMKVNERQVIYLFPDPAKILPNGDNLDHLGLECDNLAGLREYLLARGHKVGEAHRGRIGDWILGVKDPDGRPFEVTQFAPEGQLLQHQGQSLPSTRVSSHLRSATLMVADMPASRRFYCDLLGFKAFGEDPERAGSLRVEVPDGNDALVLVPYVKQAGEPSPRLVPEYTLEAREASQTGTAFIDPDGTRIVLGK